MLDSPDILTKPTQPPVQVKQPDILLTKPTQHSYLVKQHIKNIKGLDEGIENETAEKIARKLTARDLWQQHETERAKKYEKLSDIDPLTELYNRRHLGYKVENPAGEGELKREFNEALRYKHDLSFFMIDIDDFKEYNDSYGHGEGDIALKDIAAILKSKKILRTTDIPFRYGGEEFCILSPGTNIDGAKKFAKRLNEAIANIPGLKRTITVSIGIASYHNSDEFREKNFPDKIINDPDKTGAENNLVNKADEALYFSKIKGKNRFTSANELTANDYEDMRVIRERKIEE